MQILLIEDNKGDATLVKLGFKDAAPSVDLTWLTTAEAGLAALEDSPLLYDLILLDLNLPRMSGAQFVAELATAQPRREIPIMILSSAPGSQVVGAPLGSRPVGYLTKPSDLAGYRNIGTYVLNCWEMSEWGASPDISIKFKSAR
jgi:CheY-like chemotaxis protein